MQGISLIADYFLICHGNSEKQVQAIAREMKEKAEEAGIHVKRLKALMKQMGFSGYWRCCCPCFPSDERMYYNLERLWGDAPLEDRTN